MSTGFLFIGENGMTMAVCGAILSRVEMRGASAHAVESTRTNPLMLWWSVGQISSHVYYDVIYEW